MRLVFKDKQVKLVLKLSSKTNAMDILKSSLDLFELVLYDSVHFPVILLSYPLENGLTHRDPFNPIVMFINTLWYLSLPFGVP